MTRSMLARVTLAAWVLTTISFMPVRQADGQSKTENSDQPVVISDPQTVAAHWQSIVAEVNGEAITREQLANELIEVYGEDLLDTIINRKMIEQACKAKKINVDRVDVENELQAKLKTLNLSRKEFVERVLKPQQVGFTQYLRDTIWPAVALKKLVGDHVKVTDDDLNKAFEANFGEKVDCRMLVVLEFKKAQEKWEEVNAIEGLEERVAAFERICKEFSIDQATRSLGGKTQPIHRHTATPHIEKVAFDLKPGELSKIMQVPTGDPQAPSGNLILLCVQKMPANTEIKMDTVYNPQTNETVRDVLSKDITEKKIRQEVTNLYLALRKEAKIDNFLTAEFATVLDGAPTDNKAAVEASATQKGN